MPIDLLVVTMATRGRVAMNLTIELRFMDIQDNKGK